MTSFAKIRARAEKRKGKAELAAMLPKVPPRAALAKLTDDRVLSDMTKRVFSAGFSWSVIEAKWPGFEAAFDRFDPARLAFEPDEFWEGLARDPRIVRNPVKIATVRKNAAFVRAIAGEHGSFGKFLSQWPPDDQVGLLALLTKRGSHFGGATGAMFLRYIGWDAYVLSQDVVLALRDSGLDIAPEPKSKGDLAKIQARFNAYAKESGLPYAHLSRILAMSIGENRTPDYLRADTP